jgi:hypothetical protein
MMKRALARCTYASDKQKCDARAQHWQLRDTVQELKHLSLDIQRRLKDAERTRFNAIERKWEEFSKADCRYRADLKNGKFHAKQPDVLIECLWERADQRLSDMTEFRTLQWPKDAGSENNARKP